jgi:hypothetical protein
MRGLDYGSGIVYNFFFGYLRLVFPEGVTQSAKGLHFFFSSPSTINEQLFTITHGMSFVIAGLES